MLMRTLEVTDTIDLLQRRGAPGGRPLGLLTWCAAGAMGLTSSRPRPQKVLWGFKISVRMRYDHSRRISDGDCLARSRRIAQPRGPGPWSTVDVS